MPGLAASSLVFENIRLENPDYQLYRLDWIQPKKNESIKSYCHRLSKKIKHKQPILLGVSFGGIIVQELDKIVNAGAIFLGENTPEGFGDYILGSNHVLPTCRAARFSSPLSTIDFMKRTSISKISLSALKDLGYAAKILATSETLDAHAFSANLRISEKNG